jgi:flavorubredoxin
LTDLSWATERALHRAVVIVERSNPVVTSLGEALAKGMRAEGVATDLLFAEDADAELPGEYDLFAIGTPTEFLTAAPSARHLLARLKAREVENRWGFAFDTRLPHHPGHAARNLESHLRSLGLRIALAAETALLMPAEPHGEDTAAPKGATLEPTTVSAFEELGHKLVRSVRHELAEEW